MIYAAASAQNIVQAEYFVNDDPGYGNATDIPVSPGTDVTLNFIANTAGLEKGVHTLFIRAKDDNGAWSTVVNRHFLLGNYPLDPLLTIVQAEYFIDEDPGHGEGTAIFFDENEGVTEKSFVVNLDGVEVGTHMLYIRVLDENGHWSITYAEPFEVEMPLIIADFSANITEGSIPLPVQFTDETYISEPHTWFWDFGDGNTSTLQNPQHTYSEPGEYTVSLTATSDDGTDTETKVDYITVYPPPFTLEYFFNDDPGYGNGNQVYDYSSLVGGFDFNIPVDELELGLNILFFRAVDILGHWSQTYSRTFIKTRLLSDPWPHIMAAEYFFDEDPGVGNGTPVEITPGDHVEQSFIIYPGAMPPGEYTLYVRAKDDRGSWSIVFNQVFEITPSIINPPDWTPDPHYSYNMEIIGQLQYEDGSIAMNELDMVAAFVGDECRGVVSPDPNNDGILLLNVGSDLPSGETITFKAYLAGEDKVVDLQQTLVFENQLQIGSVEYPFMFTYMEETPDVLPLQNIVIGSGESFCFEAVETIITGGNGTHFEVEPGASGFLVAGENIIMRPGTHLKAGSEVHAFIDPAGGFCTNREVIVANLDEKQHELTIEDTADAGKFFRIFPNPTRGLITLELIGNNDALPVFVTVHNIMGNSIIHKNLHGTGSHVINLAGLSPGMYLIRVRQGDEVWVERVILR